MNVDLLRRLCETPGIPGREERVRELIKKEIRGLFDEVTTDAMGSLICRRAPRAKGSGRGRPTRVMLSCHMDEIGFYVKHIDDDGFIRLNAAGGFDTRNLFSRRVLVCSKHGGDIVGVMNPGGRPVHIATEEDKKKIPEVKEFLVDIGLPAAKVRKLVAVGDMVVMHEPFVAVGDKLVSKAMDNRVACWLGIESVRRLEEQGAKHACEIYSVFTVQEEVGLRGALTAARSVKPDIGIGLDVTLSCDTPGVPKDEAVTIQGQGCGLHIMDSSMISNHELIDDLEAVARKHRIRHQRTILARGGQDGGAVQLANEGTKVAGVVVGTRYIHTVTEMIHRDDLAAARDLLAAWMNTLK
ncbi:MAG: M20/M25/M40 family metallo-hydrolase [Phycisphaerales bacterium]|nr:M20/M25/M40 family metallo-hydrolase [Phycisphaerales bacterium]